MMDNETNDQEARAHFAGALKALSDLEGAEFINAMKVIATLQARYYEALIAAGFDKDAAVALAMELFKLLFEINRRG